jgi:hypothetical protein
LSATQRDEPHPARRHTIIGPVTVRGAAASVAHESAAADLVERCCAPVRRFADGLAKVPGARVLNDVVLNQVLVRFGDDDAPTPEVIRRVLADGTAS